MFGSSYSKISINCNYRSAKLHGMTVLQEKGSGQVVVKNKLPKFSNRSFSFDINMKKLIAISGLSLLTNQVLYD